TYPVIVREEEITIGNPGFRQYRYRVTWKGDSVVRMTPVGEQAKTGFSDFDNKPVEVFYGKGGPARSISGITCWTVPYRNRHPYTWTTAHWISGIFGDPSVSDIRLARAATASSASQPWASR